MELKMEQPQPEGQSGNGILWMIVKVVFVLFILFLLFKFFADKRGEKDENEKDDGYVERKKTKPTTKKRKKENL